MCVGERERTRKKGVKNCTEGVGGILLFRLKELLRNRLKECGWREQLKNHCRGRCLRNVALQYNIFIQYFYLKERYKVDNIVSII